jgi:hypothetical protein
VPPGGPSNQADRRQSAKRVEGATKWGPAHPPTGTPEMRFAGLCERGRAVGCPAAVGERGSVDVTYVGLLRGINVGHAKRVAMADLRALVEKLGYGDVRTLLNSGNIVFTGPGASPEDAAARIEAALSSRLGVSARVTVLTAAQLAAAAAANPLLGIELG